MSVSLIAFVAGARECAKPADLLMSEPIEVWQNPSMGDVLDGTRVEPERTQTQPELDLGLPPRAPASGGRRPRHSEVMESVAEFHRRFDLPMASRPRGKVDRVLAQLRVDLLIEEVNEFREATGELDAAGIADALADIVYVAYGAAVTYGIDLDAVIREVHRSNMSKLGADGRPVRRADGKVLKPSTYRPPNINAVLLDQPPLFLD